MVINCIFNKKGTYLIQIFGSNNGENKNSIFGSNIEDNKTTLLQYIVEFIMEENNQVSPRRHIIKHIYKWFNRK